MRRATGFRVALRATTLLRRSRWQQRYTRASLNSTVRLILERACLEEDGAGLDQASRQRHHYICVCPKDGQQKEQRYRCEPKRCATGPLSLQLGRWVEGNRLKIMTGVDRKHRSVGRRIVCIRRQLLLVIVIFLDLIGRWQLLQQGRAPRLCTVSKRTLEGPSWFSSIHGMPLYTTRAVIEEIQAVLTVPLRDDYGNSWIPVDAYAKGQTKMDRSSKLKLKTVSRQRDTSRGRS